MTSLASCYLVSIVINSVNKDLCVLGQVQVREFDLGTPKCAKKNSAHM